MKLFCAKKLPKFSIKQLEDNLESYVIYDVRNREEYQLGHVKNAINIPYDEVIDNIYEFKNQDKPIVLYCRTNNRSSYAASILKEADIDDISIAPGVAYYDYEFTKWGCCKLIDIYRSIIGVHSQKV